MAKTKSKVRCERCGKIVPQVYVCGVAPDVQTPLCDHCIAVTQLMTEKDFCAVCKDEMKEAPVFMQGVPMHRICYQRVAVNSVPASDAVHFHNFRYSRTAFCGYTKTKRITFDVKQVTCLTCRLLLVKKIYEQDQKRRKEEQV